MDEISCKFVSVFFEIYISFLLLLASFFCLLRELCRSIFQIRFHEWDFLVCHDLNIVVICMCTVINTYISLSISCQLSYRILSIGLSCVSSAKTNYNFDDSTCIESTDDTKMTVNPCLGNPCDDSLDGIMMIMWIICAIQFKSKFWCSSICVFKFERWKTFVDFVASIPSSFSVLLIDIKCLY